MENIYVRTSMYVCVWTLFYLHTFVIVNHDLNRSKVELINVDHLCKKQCKQKLFAYPNESNKLTADHETANFYQNYPFDFCLH